jgi:hypothetical protein
MRERARGRHSEEAMSPFVRFALAALLTVSPSSQLVIRDPHMPTQCSSAPKSGALDASTTEHRSPARLPARESLPGNRASHWFVPRLRGGSHRPAQTGRRGHTWEYAVANGSGCEGEGQSGVVPSYCTRDAGRDARRWRVENRPSRAPLFSRGTPEGLAALSTRPATHWWTAISRGC